MQSISVALTSLGPFAVVVIQLSRIVSGSSQTGKTARPGCRKEHRNLIECKAPVNKKSTAKGVFNRKNATGGRMQPVEYCLVNSIT